MSLQFPLQALAALFVIAGLFLLRLATFDPVPSEAAERIRGSLARVEFRVTPKRGEWCVVTLTPGPSTFVLQERLEDDPVLRSELVARLLPGVDVEVECPRADAGIEAAHAGQEARPIQRLSASGALLFDVGTRRGQGQGLLHLALGVASVLALCAGTRVFLLAGRMTNSGGSA